MTRPTGRPLVPGSPVALVALVALVVATMALAGCSGSGSGAERSRGGVTNDAPAAPAAPAASTAPAAGGPAADQPGGPAQAADSGPGFLVAESQVDGLEVRPEPAEGAPVEHTLAHPTASGAPLVLLVTERTEPTGTSGGWLRVLLPVRPNGAQGWVRGDDVTLSGHRWRIDVRLTDHELTVHHGEDVWMVEPIAVGQRPTPTPGGTFYLIELLEPPEPGGAYGPFAFGLSGFSEVLTSFGGGDGRLGLHGTDDPATLGGDVTNGCIRLHNEAITQLARNVPLGTPVTIHP